MMRSLWIFALFSSGCCANAGDHTGVWTGWFSDQDCARGRAKGGVYTATNPDCARQCIEKGSAVVFIAEKEKAIYLVQDYAGAKDDLGYKIEITGTLDDAANTVRVREVKRLERVALSCSRTKH